MKTTAVRPGLPSPVALWVTMALFAAGILAYAGFKSDSRIDWGCIAAITAFSLLPGALWLAWWRDTLPILPLFGVMHVFNFALPYVSASSAAGDYDDETRIGGALAISMFLFCATLVWSLVLALTKPLPKAGDRSDPGLLKRILPYGLVIPAIFTWSFVTGGVWQLGDWMPVLRAVCWNLLYVAAFLYAILLGRRQLGQKLMLFGLVMLAVNVMLLWSTLFLFSGIFVIAVALAGYVFGSGRIPLAAVLITVAVTGIMHAGKGEMRIRYWGEEATQSLSLARMPLYMAEWAGEGIASLASPSEGASLFIADRVGLAHMLLRVQQLSPEVVPFVGGETYTMIFHMLVPRFIDPDKPQTRDTQVLLNTRYGIQTLDESASTSIGWGLASEAYANFGMGGVAGLAVFIGALIGFLTRWTSGAPPVSLRTMIGVITLATLLNLEGEMAVFIVGLAQGFISVAILVVGMRALAVLRGARRAASMRAAR